MQPVPAPMPLRSMLFVPADSESKLARCTAVAADALILDLEDAVDPRRKAHARALAVEFMRDQHKPDGQDASRRSVWVRINAPGTAEFERDMAGVLAGAPDGLVVPKVRSATDVIELAHWLDANERRFDVTSGATRLMPIVTETAASVLRLDGYLQCGRRLSALTWGAEDLCVALGAAENVDADGQWLPPYQLARSLCLITAAAAGVPAIDTVFTTLRDHEGLARSALAARRDGFSGKMAIHPEQVEIINRAFQPGREELERAARIVAAFEAAGTGVVAFEGRMLDLPHLARARRILRSGG